MGELDHGWWGKILRDGFFHVLLGTCRGEGSSAENVLPPAPSALLGRGTGQLLGQQGQWLQLPADSQGWKVPSSSVVQGQETHVPVFNKLRKNLYPSMSTM